MKRFMCLMLALVLLSTALGCSKAGMGAYTGAATGAAVGAMASRNKLVGGAIGAGAGFVLGYMIGNELDKKDLEKAAAVLERGKTGVPVKWKGESGESIQATPAPVMQTEEGVIYRDMVIRTQSGDDLYVRAYRKSNGNWELYGY